MTGRFVLAATLLAAACAFAADKPGATIRISGEGVTADIAFEKGGRIAVTSKPAPIKPGQYFVKSIDLSMKDDKGKTWEIRSIPGKLETLSTLTVDADQEKLLILGPKIIVKIVGDAPAGGVMKIHVQFLGNASEIYLPWAFVNGKHPAAPSLTVKDKDGKDLGGGPLAVIDSGVGTLVWKIPSGFKGDVTCVVSAEVGPFELVQSTRPFQVK